MNEPTSTRSFLDPTLAEMVDQVCDRFEATWKVAGNHGPPPALADYLDGVEGPARSVLLRELLALELAYRRRRGERPILTEYRKRFPDHDTLIDSVWGEAAEAATLKAPPAAGESLPHPGPPASGDAARQVHVPGYEILGELGRGGMGVVYLANNVLMKRPEVLKILNKGLLDSHPGMAERFLREIQAAAKLDHENVVKAYSALQMGDLLVFAMEYVEGEDLAKLVQRQGPLPVAHACHYVSQAAMGLQHAQERGMVHRDIKPHNLILTLRGKRHLVKVLDFGLAKAIGGEETAAHLTREGAVLGTPAYMAPEQAQDAAKVDIRTDMYSLGCTLYFLLTGAPPFTGKSYFAVLKAHESAEAPSLTQLRAGVPVELALAAAKMLAKDPARRYQQPIDVAKALAPIIKAAAQAPNGGAAAAGLLHPTSSQWDRPTGAPIWGDAPAGQPRRESEIETTMPPSPPPARPTPRRRSSPASGA